MAEEATPSGAGQTANPQDANPTNNQPEATQHGFTAADFADPLLGPKLKNFQRMHEDGATARKAAEKERDAERDKLTRLGSFYRQNPDLYKQMTDRESGVTQVANPDDDPAEPQNDEDKYAAMQARIDNLERKGESDLALHGVYGSLGQGNTVEGQRIFAEKYQAQANELVTQMRQGNAQAALGLAMELLKGREKPTQSVAPTAPQPEPGSTSSEASRGVAAPAPRPAPVNDDEHLGQILRDMGHKDPHEYARAVEAETGAFGER